MPMLTSENDKRLYRVIELANGLKAVLVSSINDPDDPVHADHGDDCSWSGSASDCSESADDSASDCSGDTGDSHQPKEKMAAAALAVKCGSFQNPADLGGLAHYLEHMLFMGSEKYPIENEYAEFVSKHGGSENAFTDTEMTVYYFDVAQPAFAHALDVFANFFVNPLFREDALDREVEAIESEFQLQQVSDENRLAQVLGGQAGEEHPMGRFMWGNLKTLRDVPREKGINMRNRIMEFYNHYYSADVMTLCVQSKHSLDELEQLVRDSFSGVPRKQRAPIVYPTELPFSQNPNFHKLFKVVPMSQDITVTFNWILPAQADRYREKALDYLGYAIGHEGENSILDHLRKKQYALELTAGTEGDGFSDNAMCSMFSIAITLSKEGARNIAEVTNYVHQYIHMLRKKGPQQWLWNELRDIEQFDFRFLEEYDAQDYVCGVCQSMQRYPEEHYLCGENLYFDYDPENIQNLMNMMTPEACNISYQNYEFRQHLDQFVLREPYMDVPYSIEDYPEDWRRLWVDDPDFQSRFSLPEPNRYIPTDFSIKTDEAFAHEEFPKVIAEREATKIWYRKDQKFLVPKSFVDTHLITRVPYDNVRNAVCVDAMTDILSQLLAQTNSYAEMASLDYEINGYNSGVTLTFSGFNHKLPLLFETVLSALVSFDCSEELFHTITLNLRKHYFNNVLINTRYGDEVRSNMVHQKYHTMAERREALKSITKADVVENTRNLCRSAFIEAYVHGNVTSAEALDLIGSVESKFAAQPREKVVDQPHAVVEGETYVRFLSINPEDKNSRIINYYVYGPAHFYEETLMQFLVTLMEERCFNQLRTEQQLGYDARCTMNCYRGVIGFTVSVSPAASKFTLSHVDQKIDEFVECMTTMIQNLTDEEFNTVKESTIKVKQCVDLSMEDEQKRNWNQILQFQYIFDRNHLEVQFLKGLELERFRKWCLRVLPSKDRGPKKISVQVVGYGKEALEECVGGEEIWKEFDRLLEKGEKKEHDPEIPPMKMLFPKNPGTKTFVSDLQAYLNNRKFYPLVSRDPREKFEL